MTSRDRSLDYTCQVCGAAPKEECESHSGGPRFESHPERVEAMHLRELFRKHVKLPAMSLGLVEKPLASPKKIQKYWIAKVISFR
jgi:hypothetical protein